MPISKSELIFSSLLGGAIGDSLGAEIEFQSQREILAQYPDGFVDLPMHQGIVGAITDDTQMTIFTLEGLISAEKIGAENIDVITIYVHHALLKWLETQGCRTKVHSEHEGMAFSDLRLHKMRAPGMTCIDALSSAEIIGAKARNDSKGCGTIMRVAPVAFFKQEDLSKVKNIKETLVAQLAESTSYLTHGHETGADAATAWAVMLNLVWNGVGLEQSIAHVKNLFNNEVNAAIELASIDPELDDKTYIETMNGGGWTAEDALAISLYACRKAQSFEHGLTLAVSHSGDSDSTGAIAGNMLGLMFPEEVISHRWSAQVECRDLIKTLSHQLAGF